MTNTANPHGVKLVQLGVEASATELNVLKGITTSTAELNKLKGLNTSTAELNKLKGATITTAELNTLKGIGTSTVASQLSAVADAAAAAQRTADASMSNIEVTGSGNAITAASYDSTTRKLTLTKGANYAPTTRTINSKALSSDINLTAADVGALATDGSNVMTGNLFIEEADLCIDDGSLGIRNGDVVIDGNNPFVGLANKNATTQCELANLGNVTILTHMSLDDERTLEIHDNTSAPNIKNALIFSNVNDNGRNTYSVYHEGNKPTAADVGVSFTAAKTSGTHIGTITLDGVDTKIYCNSGDITGVTAGNGLTGGATNGTATLNVGAGDGISVTADAVALATSGVTAGTYGPGADVTGSNNTTMSVPEITVDTYGRVTNITNRTYTAKNSTYTVNNKTVTLTAGKGLTDGGSFTANQSSDKTITFNVGAGTGIAVNDNDVALATYGTAATYGPSDDATLSHSGTFTVPKITTDAYGRVTASNITYTLPASGNTDTQVTTTATSPSSEATWYLTGTTTSSTKTNDKLVKHTGLRASMLNGTTSTVGKAQITLGNSTASGTANNMIGNIALYSKSTSYHLISPADTTSAITHTLPAVTGTLINSGNLKNGLTKSSLASAATTTTSSRQYAVEYDSDGKLSVNVPWTDSNTDTKVTQSAAITTAGNYPVLLGYSTATSAVTNTVNKSAGLLFNPSTKILTLFAGSGATSSGIQFSNSGTLKGHIGCNTDGGVGIYANKIFLRTGAISSDGTINTDGGITIEDGAILPAKSNTIALGNNSYRLNSVTSSFYRSIVNANSTTNGYYLYGGPSGSDPALYGYYQVAQLGTAGDGTNQGTQGYARLALGNATARTSTSGQGANNARGQLIMYGSGSDYSIIYAQGGKSGTDNANTYNSIYFPAYNGSLYLLHAGSTSAVGSATKPVYIAANGRATACTYTLNKSVPSDAVFTDGNVKQGTSTTSSWRPLLSHTNYAAYGTDPGATTGQVYYTANISLQPSTGSIKASNVYGAVWNDYAEYRESNIIEPGRVICENGDDTLSLATERLQPGANVVSDTFGFAIGETEKAKTPIAVSGRVLVYPYEPSRISPPHRHIPS